MIHYKNLWRITKTGTHNSQTGTLNPTHEPMFYTVINKQSTYEWFCSVLNHLIVRRFLHFQKKNPTRLYSSWIATPLLYSFVLFATTVGTIFYLTKTSNSPKWSRVLSTSSSQTSFLVTSPSSWRTFTINYISNFLSLNSQCIYFVPWQMQFLTSYSVHWCQVNKSFWRWCILSVRQEI